MKYRILKNSIFLFLFFSVGLELNAQDSSFSSHLLFRISSDNDDVEESEDGVMSFESSDLELVDESSNQTVGLRFTDIALPRGINIINARVQFAVDEETNGACSLSIRGEMTENASPFENTNNNISSRELTMNSVQWSPEPWVNLNEAGSDQRTPDISSVIIEIINQDNWTEGNALVLVITGEGTRTAVAYNKDPQLAAKLIIETESSIVNVPLEHLYINEIMSKNNSFYDEYGESDDWIELYNADSLPVYVGGVYLSDDANDLLKWQLLNPLTIEAKSFALIWADKDAMQGSLHTSFKLSGSGETLYLSQLLNDQIIEIDSVSFDTIAADVSYGRKDDGSENWILLGEASPNSTNNYSRPALVEPTVSLESGIYYENQFVELSSDADSVSFYYTIDGTIPDTSGIQYIEPIQIDSTTLLKVIAFKEGSAPGRLVERFYLFNHNSSLPVFSISTDPKNLWDDYTGIYIEGKNGAIHYNYHILSNFFQPWERLAVITMLEPDGSVAFCENAGIALSGNDSKKFIQKSFNLHFRKKYGTNGVDYQVFKNMDITKFKHLKLRNSGQDFLSMMMRDGINHSILQGAVDVDLMDYRPAVLYLNGEYWGMYGLRESLTDDFVDTHFDVKKSEIDLLTRDGDIIIESGSASDYQDMYNFIENHSMADQSYYTAVSGRLDIDEFINYQIAEIYFGNYDWPSNNQKMWHAGADHKWRWMLYDTDCSTNYDVWGDTYPGFNSLQFTTDPYSSNWPNSARSSLIFRMLLENQEFKYEFVQRMCTYMSLVFNKERVHAITDTFVNMVEGEIDREIEKWTQDYTGFGIGLACGGSKEQWLTNIDDYKEFFAERPAYMMQFIKDKFSNNSTYLLGFNYSTQTKGTVYINSCDVEIPYHFSSEYFSNYPLKIKAVPDSGYVFVKWMETGDTSAATSFTGTEICTLTPVFALAGTNINNPFVAMNYQMSVYPNPAAAGRVHLSISGFKIGEDLALSIYNLVGQEIDRYSLDTNTDIINETIDITDWSSGIYFLKIHSISMQKTVKLIVKD